MICEEEAIKEGEGGGGGGGDGWRAERRPAAVTSKAITAFQTRHRGKRRGFLTAAALTRQFYASGLRDLVLPPQLTSDLRPPQVQLLHTSTDESSSLLFCTPLRAWSY